VLARYPVSDGIDSGPDNIPISFAPEAERNCVAYHDGLEEIRSFLEAINMMAMALESTPLGRRDAGFPHDIPSRHRQV
jgi:hypothetical protein